MEEYEQFIQNREKGEKSFNKVFSNIKDKHVIALFIVGALGTLLYYKNPQSLKTILLVLAAVIIVWLISLSKNMEKGIIPRHIAQMMAQKDLEREIGPKGSFPQGTTIIPTGYCNLRKVGDIEIFSYKWWVGFKLKSPNKPEKEIIVKLNPYTGDTMSIGEAPTGFSGNEKEFKDIMYVFPETTFSNPKKEEKSAMGT